MPLNLRFLAVNGYWQMLVAISLLFVCVLASPSIEDAILLGLDGSHVRILIRQSNDWLPIGPSLSIDQIRGAGNLVAPLNTNLMWLYRLQLSFLGQINIVVTALLCALELFFATFVLARALTFPTGTAIAAGWAIGFVALPSIWFPLVYPIVNLVPHIADILVGTCLMVALFLGVGRGAISTDVLRGIGILAVALYLTVTNPILVVLIGPSMVTYGVAALASAESRREAIRKGTIAVFCLSSYATSGAVSFLLGIAEDSSPRFFSNELMWTQQSTFFASIFFHVGAPFSLLAPSAVVMSAVEGVWRAVFDQGRTRRLAMGHLAMVAITVGGGWILVTMGKKWAGPSMLYFEFAVWPFYAVYATALLFRLARLAYGLAVKAGLSVGIANLRGETAVAAALVPIAIVAIAIERRSSPVNGSFYPYPPRAEEISMLLRREIGLEPGAQFRGRLATFTRVAESSEANWFDMHAYDADLYRAAGTELRFLGPWYYDIPTLQEYNQAITPAQYLIQSRFLARRGDKQMRNIALFTRPDADLLRAWGVRYVASDIEVPGAAKVATLPWSSKHPPVDLFEFGGPNIGGYSPTVVRLSKDMNDAMAFLAAKPDLRREVALFEPVDEPLTAGDAVIEAHRGFLKVFVRSRGRSLLLLPYEYTRCYRIEVVEGDPDAILVRANIAQAALVVRGPATVKLVASYGIPLHTGCRRADAKDVERLGIEQAIQAYPPGVGR